MNALDMFLAFVRNACFFNYYIYFLINSSSPIISIFSSIAFSFLEGPILCPANINDVFLEIEDDAFPPPSTIIAFNSFLEYFSKTPEKKPHLPLKYIPKKIVILVKK